MPKPMLHNKQWEAYYATMRFLTILPTPKFHSKRTPQVAMFPLVGLTLGVLLYFTMLITSALQPPIITLLVLLVWLISTGFLHLDGLADLADGLGAAHQNPERLLPVMQASSIGVFGVIALIVLILAKYVLLLALAFEDTWAALLLIPAWARLGSAWWLTSLPALSDGLAAWCKSSGHINLTTWFMILLILSLIFAPMLLFAPLILWVWKAFLAHQLGGMNGDALGAGIEITEVGLLFLCCLAL